MGAVVTQADERFGDAVLRGNFAKAGDGLVFGHWLWQNAAAVKLD